MIPAHLPWIWGDYNTVGLSDEPGDRCIYSLDRTRMAELRPRRGLRLFVWEHDDAATFIGQVCSLEYVPHWRGAWRACPLHDLCRGPLPDHARQSPPDRR